MTEDPDYDDDGSPKWAADRERARNWAHLNHAERPWMITATGYPHPPERTPDA